VSGTQRLGVSQTEVNLAEANIIYSFRIISTGVGDVATLDLASGAITQTTGTPSVVRKTGATSDLAGVEFEGVALPTADTINAIDMLLIDVPASKFASAEISTSNFSSVNAVEFWNIGDRSLITYPLGTPADSGGIAFAFDAAGITIEVTIAGTSA
jgi:hypothetical protein